MAKSKFCGAHVPRSSAALVTFFMYAQLQNLRYAPGLSALCNILREFDEDVDVFNDKNKTIRVLTL